MDRLASDRQEQLRKSSTERLRVKLIQSGWDEDQVMEMDRPTVMDAAAEICLAKEQASVAARAPLPAEVRSRISSPGPSALRLKELEIEEKRAEREIEMRRAELEAETKRIEAEAEARRAEAEDRRIEREAAQAMERQQLCSSES